MGQDVTTITISIVNGAIEVNPDDPEGDKAVGRKEGIVQWMGDGSVTGMWVVGLKGAQSPFKDDRRAFSQIGAGIDGEKIKSSANTGDEFQYAVFCQTAAGPLFRDPIIVIRDSTKDFDTLIVEMTEELAIDARALANRADEVAGIARLAGQE